MRVSKGPRPGEEASGPRTFKYIRRPSERNARAEAPLARLVRPYRRCDEAEVCAGDVRCRIGEVRVVGRVQRLRANLELHTFRDGERAEDARVRLEEAGSAKSVSAPVSESLREYGGA